MRNYYALLGLNRDCSTIVLAHKLKQLEKQEPELARVAKEVMIPIHRRLAYDRTHRQYETAAKLWEAFADEDMLNTNRWEHRLAEFT